MRNLGPTSFELPTIIHHLICQKIYNLKLKFLDYKTLEKPLTSLQFTQQPSTAEEQQAARKVWVVLTKLPSVPVKMHCKLTEKMNIRALKRKMT